MTTHQTCYLHQLHQTRYLHQLRPCLTHQLHLPFHQLHVEALVHASRPNLATLPQADSATRRYLPNASLCLNDGLTSQYHQNQPYPTNPQCTRLTHLLLLLLPSFQPPSTKREPYLNGHCGQTPASQSYNPCGT